ncbi:MAG TPA: polysaccharide lyase family 7 protein [Pseudonocardiaceae bacterium]
MAHHRKIRGKALGIGLGALALALLSGTASAAPALNPGSAPGGNFNLSVWELQEPVGSPGSPTTISSSQLQGANGYQDKYFYTNKTDGSMDFWDPENGVTTPNSNYARSELREMTSSGSMASWSLPGTHTLSASVKVTKVPDHVCVGQVHATDPRTTKPLAELYFHSNGQIQLGIENGPSGGQTPHTVGSVPLGQQFSYVIQITGGNTISVTINGSKHSFPIPSSWKGYNQYFKAGDYDQSSGSSSTVGATVQFYSLTVQHA